jgi:hypothetical protein
MNIQIMVRLGGFLNKIEITISASGTMNPEENL